jgi:hypothetical protein
LYSKALIVYGEKRLVKRHKSLNGSPVVYYPFWGLVLLIADKYFSPWGIFLGGAILVDANRTIQFK